MTVESGKRIIQLVKMGWLAEGNMLLGNLEMHDCPVISERMMSPYLIQ